MAKSRLKTSIRTAIAVIAVLTVVVVLATSSSEPEYAGKKLSYWLPRAHNESLPEDERAEISQAITTIGTNNTKLLLKWFREPMPTYEKPWYRKLADSAIAKFRLVHLNVPIWEARFRPSHPEMAFWVFNEFPTVARTAIPAFTNMALEGDITLKGKAALILGQIGKDAIPALIPILSSADPTNRSLAAFALGKIGPDAIPTIPYLELLLKDKSPYPILNAAEALSKLKGDPRLYVPALIQCLREGDNETKSYASYVLGTLTNDVPLVVSGLVELLEVSTNKDIQLSICTSLNSIDPETAAKKCTNIFYDPALELARAPR